MARPGGPVRIADGIWCLPLAGANVYFVQSGPAWVLIDAGWQRSGSAIMRAAGWLTGAGRVAQEMPAPAPSAILLTHAHPDHVAGAAALAREWACPVYLHPADIPLLTSEIYSTRQDLLDPVGRILLPVVRLMPAGTRRALMDSELSGVVTALPAAGSVPHLAGWQYVETPGHTAGHVVFVRPADRIVIAGDAVVTAALAGTVSRCQRLSHPMRFVSWDTAKMRASYRTLADLEPRVLATGHGVPMRGDVAARLHAFAERNR